MDLQLNPQSCQTSPVESARSVARNDHVQILLALHNGARFLSEQLQSLGEQLHENWSLLVSDDGSTDFGHLIVSEFGADNPDRIIRVMTGPGSGFARNFAALIRAADDSSDFFAFCDQDDFWQPSKLSQAVDVLLDANGPALYCGRTMNVRHDLRAAGQSPLFRREPEFRNALVQSIAGGNTMVFNKPALCLMQRALQSHCGFVSHDWWAYQLVSGVGGTVIYDPHPQVLYRQHGLNLVGANRGLQARFDRLRRLLSGQLGEWGSSNIAALRAIWGELTPDAKAALVAYEDVRKSRGLTSVMRLRRAGLHRQTRGGTVALYLAALLGRL